MGCTPPPSLGALWASEGGEEVNNFDQWEGAPDNAAQTRGVGSIGATSIGAKWGLQKSTAKKLQVKCKVSLTPALIIIQMDI